MENNERSKILDYLKEDWPGYADSIRDNIILALQEKGMEAFEKFKDEFFDEDYEMIKKKLGKFNSSTPSEDRYDPKNPILMSIREVIVERVPGLDEGCLKILMSTLEAKKDWDLAVASIAEDIVPKKLQLLKSLSTEASFKSFLNNIKTDISDAQEDRSSTIKATLSQIQQLIVERVPGLDEGSLKILMSTLEEKKDWDQAVASIAEDIVPKKLKLLKSLSTEASFKNFLNNIKTDTTDAQENSSSPIKGKLSQMQQLIVERVPGLDEGSLKILMSTLEEKKDWDQAVASIAEDIVPKKLELLKSLSTEASFKSFLNNIKTDISDAQEDRSSTIKATLSQMQQLIVERAPGLDEGCLKILMSTLEETKDWDLAVASIAEDIVPKKLNLLKSLSTEASFKSFLNNIKTDISDAQEDRSSTIKATLSQIQQLIVERVPGLDEGCLKILMSTLEETKDWDLAVASITEDIVPKKLNLLKSLSTEASFKGFLNNIKTDISDAQEDRSSTIKATLSQIQQLIVERVPDLDEGSLKILMSTLEEKKDWDLAVAFIAEDIVPKKLNLLKSLSKEICFQNFIENIKLPKIFSPESETQGQFQEEEAKAYLPAQKSAHVRAKETESLEYFEEAKINEKNEHSEDPKGKAEHDQLHANKKKIMLLQELHDNYKGMPQCFEKCVIFLIYYTTMLTPDFKLQQNLGMDYEMAIDNEFELLKVRAKKEELESDDIIKSLENIETYKIQKDWEAISKILKGLLQKIRPLDIKSMMTLIGKVNHAAKAIRGRDVFLVLGKTGVGKSTLTHFLAGSQMGRQEIETFSHIGPIGEIQNPDLRGVIPSPFTTSETRYITPVNITHRGESIILCDSPGFEDTSGPEVDIANCLGIVKAIQGCKTVKPIILLSNKSGDRFQAVKELAHILVGMIPSIQDHLSSFSYVFTKFRPDELKAIPAILKNIIDNFKSEELADKSFTTFIYDMETKVKKHGPKAIDVINNDRDSILQDFVISEKIFTPEEVFKVSISLQSKRALQEQALKHQLTINSAAKRADYDLVKYKMDDLKIIKEALNQDFICNIYEECVKSLVKIINQSYYDSVEFFTQRLTSKNALTEADVLKYKDFIKKADAAEPLRDTHLGTETISLAAYENKVRTEIEALCSKVCSLSLAEILVIRDIADKVKLISKVFPSFESDYHSLLKTMVGLVESSFQKFETSKNTEDFQACGRELHMLHSAQQYLSDHLNSEILKKFTLARDVVYTMLKTASSKFDELFKKDSLIEKDATEISKAVKMLIAAKEAFNLQPYVSLKIIDDNHTVLIEKIESFFLKLISKIEKKLKGECNNTFEGLESDVYQITLIRTIPTADFKTSESYYMILNKILNSVKDVRIQIELTLMNSFDKGETNYKELNLYLTRLRTAKWIEKYREGLYQDIFADIQGQITQHLNHLKKNVKGANLDLLDSFYQIIPTAKKVSEALDMQSLVENFPKIEESVKEISKAFFNAIEQVFSQIVEDCNEDMLSVGVDPSKTEKMINYIEHCKGVSILSNSNRNKAEISLNKFLKTSSERMQYEFNEIIAICEAEKNYSDKEFSLKVHTLSKLLHDIDEIYNDYKKTSSYFPKVMETWKKGLSGLIKELTNKLELCLQTKEPTTTIWLEKVKILSKIDEFIDGHEKFSHVFRNYSSQYFQESNSIQLKLIEELKDYKYKDASAEMNLLKLKNDNLSKHHLQKATQYFKNTFTELVDSIRSQIIMLTSQLTTKELQMIQSNLRKVDDAKNMMNAYMDNAEVEIHQKGFTSALSSKILTYLAGISISMVTGNFADAETKVSHAGTIKELIPPYYLSEEVHTKISELTDTQKNHIDKITNEYAELPIEEYWSKPPKLILEKLDAVKEANAIYADAQDRLKAAIKKKFLNYFEEVKRKVTFSQAQHPNPFRTLQEALEYLPLELNARFSKDIEIYKTEFIDVMKRKKIEFDDAMTTKPPKLDILKQIYIQNIDSLYSAIAKDVRNFILDEAKKYEVKLNEYFINFQAEDVLQSLKVIYDLNKIFGNNIEEVASANKGAQKKFSQFITDLFSSVIDPVTKLDNSAVITPEIVNRTENRYDEILKIIKFKQNENTEQYKEMFPSDLKDNYIRLNKTIAGRLRKIQQGFNEGLQNMNPQVIPEIKSSIVAMQNWSELSMKMKKNIENDPNPDFNFDELFKDLPENGITMKNNLICKFKSLKTEIDETCNNLVEDTSNFSKRRADEYYKKLNENLNQFKLSLQFKEFDLEFNPDHFVEECERTLEKRIQEINKKTASLLEDTLKQQSQQGSSRTFTVYFKSLCSISENLDEKLSLLIDTDNMKEKILEKMRTMEKECNDEINPDPTYVAKFGEALKGLKLLSLNTEILKEMIDSIIDGLLGKYREVAQDRTLTKLGLFLNKDKSGLGANIIVDHKCFDAYSHSLFAEKTQKHGIDYVLSNLEGDNVDQTILQKRYKAFHEEYESIIKANLKVDMNLEGLITNSKMIFGNITQYQSEIKWDHALRSKIPSLMAHIFAIWTLQNANNYFDAQGLDNQANYLLQPHAAQVISIFRLLGIGDKNEQLASNLVQIGTGEGKSITMAATACVLALCGFEVSCACYSEYLCRRDSEAMKSLFQCLDLLDYIHYGTFAKLCEDMINRSGNIREVLSDLISKGKWVENRSGHKKRARILLIDEVDVFFHKDCYGNVYTPSASLSHPDIQELTDYIWKNRGSKLRVIKDSTAYKKCCARFQGWEFLIEEAVKGMLADIKTFESHDYLVKDDKIAYKDHTNLVFNIVYGYKTLFAYYKESPKNISLKSLQENIKINIRCGTFSYAEIPKQFEFIMGVTGTLKTLSQPEVEIINRDYNIQKKTYTPSVFGKNKLNPLINVKIENEDDYFTVISDEILKISQQKRAVLVFFENEKKLMEFYNSKSCDWLKPQVGNEVQYLTEEASSVEKDIFIKSAAVSGRVNLLTRSFGRGTDFICHEEPLIHAGGIHVLQTFLSEELSEETQIKGRTARQGAEGSYSMVLLNSSLEKFDLTIEEIKYVLEGTFNKIKRYILRKDTPSVYDVLNEKRNDYFQKQYESNAKYVENAKNQHKKSLKFTESLFNKDREAVNFFLKEQNKGASDDISCRILCLMDATGSMASLLQNAKNTIGTMFERATNILIQNGQEQECFELQFAVYRNYSNDSDTILEYSPWESKPENLRKFMDRIKPSGGLGNEAIEIGFWHANQEFKIDRIHQIILIGDQPANTEDEVTSKRKKRFGETYWNQTKFKDVTHYKNELAALKKSGIRVNAFYVHDNAKDNFTEIAKETNGRWQFLDINSAKGAEILTGLVTEEILKTVGNIKGVGDKYALDYISSYGKSYA